MNQVTTGNFSNSTDILDMQNEHQPLQRGDRF